MPSKDKRKLAAIMFADVVGYSRMMASNEERTLELLKDFENICSPIISKHDGEIIKKVGDELFCEFSSAKQAVDSALEIQEAIQPYNDSRPKDFKLQVRIGIHVGDIVLRDGDVYGDGVNVASRIQPFANPGGICISSAVKEAVSSHPNYNIISEGQQELKNILEKHTLYRVETGYETVDKNRHFREQVNTGNFLKLSNGYTYYEIKNENSINTLIFIHGFSVPSYIWDGAFNSASKKGYKTIRLDLYGRGYSSNLDVDYTDELFANQVIELMNELDIQKATLIGLSNGGRVISKIAYLKPKIIEKLIKT